MLHSNRSQMTLILCVQSCSIWFSLQCTSLWIRASAKCLQCPSQHLRNGLLTLKNVAEETIFCALTPLSLNPTVLIQVVSVFQWQGVVWWQSSDHTKTVLLGGGRVRQGTPSNFEGRWEIHDKGSIWANRVTWHSRKVTWVLYEWPFNCRGQESSVGKYDYLWKVGVNR